MSTPPSSPPPQGYDRPYYGSGMPPIPTPNGELIVFLLVWFVIGVVTLVTDGEGGVDPSGFVRASVALAIGYMVARGIAKAGKVFEGR
ncbi:MAG: hypothetical protein KY396_03365 [Actinobacteria bacterium]|nr:hypothetical protein [Actinomycetota bacterium]